MDLPRRTDEKSRAYWRMIDEAAERVRRIAERHAFQSPSGQPKEQAKSASQVLAEPKKDGP